MPSSGGSSQPRVEPRSPALQVDSLPSEPPGKPIRTLEGTWPSCRCQGSGWVLKVRERTGSGSDRTLFEGGERVTGMESRDGEGLGAEMVVR